MGGRRIDEDGRLNPAPLVVARSLVKKFELGGETVHAVRGVDFVLHEGDFVAIMGSSGSGKSTFMNMLGALDTPTSGSIVIGGMDVATLDDNALARLRNEHVGFVFQQFNLLPRTTAIDNVALPLVYAGVGTAERRERARAVLAKVGLGGRMEHTPARLSGGQQQRVAIARALVTKPLLLLADEPTGALDTVTSDEIMDLLLDLNDEGVTVVLVTHEPQVAAYARRRVVFRDGLVLDDRSILKRRRKGAPS